MTTGTEAIATERQRQIEKEGYTSEHDRHHEVDTLVMAALCYATPWDQQEMRQFLADGSGDRGDRYATYPVSWPWHPRDFKPAGQRRNLVKAGALIAAAIDRLDVEAQR